MSLPAANIISGCANTGNPVVLQCHCSRPRQPEGLQGVQPGDRRLHRGKTNVNLGSVMTSGIDMQLAYTQDLPPGFGNVHFDMNGSWFAALRYHPRSPAVSSYDCAGLFGFTCQTVESAVGHHIFRTTWNTPLGRIGIASPGVYIGAVGQDANTGNPLLANPNYKFGRIQPTHRLLQLHRSGGDLAIRPRILTVRAGANNVLDRKPAALLVAQTGIIAGGQREHLGCLRYVSGRQLFVAFTAKF